MEYTLSIFEANKVTGNTVSHFCPEGVCIKSFIQWPFLQSEFFWNSDW